MGASVTGMPAPAPRRIRLAIVGGGPSMPAVTAALRGMPVTWLGSLGGADLARAYAAMDVFVHTGTEETFGQTIQEAHASGLPVIAPRSGGPIDLVDHGTDGFLFHPDRDPELRAYVELLSTSARRRARMGEAGRRAVLGRSWDSVCDELMAHYTDAIETRRLALAAKQV